MKLIIELDEKQFKDIQRIASIQIIRRSSTCEQIIANGTPLSKFLEELKRKILMEVDGGTDDRYLSYIDICGRISNSIDEYKAESEELKGE